MNGRGRRAFAAIFLLLCLWAAPGAAAPPADPRSLTFPPLTYEIPRAERFTLPSGLVVHLLSDRTLPWIQMTAYTNVGAVYEPAEKTGLATLTGRMIRRGGIAGQGPDEVDAELDFMASSISAAIGDDAGVLSLTTLTRNFLPTLRLFAGMMTAPAFAEGRFVQSVNELLESLRRQNDNPREVAERELQRAIYGDHPLGRHPTPATVRAVTRTDLAAFHRRFYHPTNTVLAVSGDIGRQDLEAALNAALAGWQRERVELPAVPRPQTAGTPSRLYIHKGIVQSVIRMGHLGISKDNPDLHAIRVMDFILGAGGFNSRLMNRIRNEDGLAYSVASGFEIGRRYPGLFVAQTETKSASTGRAIGLLLGIMGDMTREPVKAEELALAKASIVNAFVFAFTDAERIVNQRARIEFYGYPDHYLEDYRDRVAAVTTEDVLRAARTYLHPEKLVTVVVGDRTGFDQLSAFGEVREIRPEF